MIGGGVTTTRIGWVEVFVSRDPDPASLIRRSFDGG